MPSNITKQIQFMDGAASKLNAGTGDTVQGGQLTAVPSGLTASQGIQNIPGDRIVLGAADALVLSSTTVGTLYSGIYMYIFTNPSAGAAVKGRLAFWDASQFSTASSTYPTPDNLYQVTPAELQTGTGRVPPIAGIFINALAQGTYWWIQIAGRATASFGALAGSQFGTASAYAINMGVFAGGYGTTAGSGFVTQINGDTFATTDVQIADMITQFVGVADVAPTASASSIITLKSPLLGRF